MKLILILSLMCAGNLAHAQHETPIERFTELLKEINQLDQDQKDEDSKVLADASRKTSCDHFSTQYSIYRKVMWNLRSIQGLLPEFDTMTDANKKKYSDELEAEIKSTDQKQKIIEKIVASQSCKE